MKGVYIYRIIFFILALVFVSSDSAVAAPKNEGILAQTVMEAKIYRIDPLPSRATGAVSAWLYTMTAPDFYLTKEAVRDNLRDNLRENAQKFCAGSDWKLIQKNLYHHRIEFSFACYSQKALAYKKAAIAQGIPAITLP